VLRRSTHGPARRSQAPRRATRGPWPRLRYRLNSSRPFASARTAADRERQAGPICPFIGGLAPAGIPSQALAGSPRGRVPASALRGARSTLGLRGRSARTPLTPSIRCSFCWGNRPPPAAQLRPVAPGRITDWLCAPRGMSLGCTRLPHGGADGSRPEKLAPTAVLGGGVASIVSGQSPIVADLSALSGSDFVGRVDYGR